MTYTFTEARRIARMSCDEIADYLELSKSTVKRYEKTSNAPKAVIECLLMNGYLYSPAGERFTSGDVLARTFDLQLIREQQLELKTLRKKVSKKKPSNIIPFPQTVK